MRESPAEASKDSQNDSKPQIPDTSQNTNSETDSKTFAEVDSTPRFRKGFRRKKGESPYVCDMNVKFKKEKKQSTFLNPDPWARLVGSRNTAAIYIDGIATTALYDTGAELQLISKEFCEQNELKIQPIEQLIECKGVVGTGLLEYDGYVEVNVQIPGRDFSEDHLFLVSSMMNSQKDMPVIVGNFFIDSLNKYLKNLPQEEFETLDKTIQNVYYARIEASRIKEQYGCEPPQQQSSSANFLIWSGNSQRYLIRQEGIPKTGQGIQCKVMEYTFCHFIIIFAKYNKWPNNPNWFKILMPHPISLAESMNLEHSVTV